MKETREAREEREAAEAYRKKKLISRTYAQVRRQGGPVADILAAPERLSPGSVGFDAQSAREKRERRRIRSHLG